MKTSLDESRRTAYDLIASHGDVENLIFLAMLMKGELEESWMSFSKRLYTYAKLVVKDSSWSVQSLMHT